MQTEKGTSAQERREAEGLQPRPQLLPLPSRGRLPTAWCPEAEAQAQAAPPTSPSPFSRGNKGAEGTSLRLPPQVFPELSLRVGLHLGGAAPGGDDKETEAGDPPCTTTLQPHAPTYAAQLPVEVAPAGLLAAPIQPARPFQHNLLLRGKSDSRPPCAGRSHELGRPGDSTQDSAASASQPTREAGAASSSLHTLPSRGRRARRREPAPGGRPAQCEPGSRAPT